MKRLSAALLVFTLCFHAFGAAESEEGFVSLMDGKTFNGWKSSIDSTNTWQVEDGAVVTRGKTAHLFDVGDEKPFKNF